ncbi:hypothetical protein TEA_021131 [Camellia sinensis var. sinensis]|uniref:RING-type domain-containing protein n=1 Tax=Camellia sinensis var. sinensis TaxID=542762 RepID=A0A4S4DRH7_CAMSN|nr:hypothetical protein TEA_021131 [Camellia sinensis var. sinensis]
MVCDNTIAKPICSVCYEDLNPIIEDLQSISICGHVFHELCLQQRIEYCSNAKKKRCPVCKQAFSEANVSRLYFQSVGNLYQKSINCEDNPGELRREIETLEGEVLGLRSAIERYQKDVEELSKELCFSKEQARKEATLKNEALRQNASIQQLFHLKSEAYSSFQIELDRSTLECVRLQERNMALAKELAALKLSSDLNLEEEEVMKLASLASFHRSCKELTAKCNVLGRGEARALRKLGKAKEKIKKLKARIQELKTAVEVKDNEVLRALKASKKTILEGDILNDVDWNSNSSSISEDLAVEKNCFSRSEAASDTRSEVHRPCNKDGVSGSRSVSKGDTIHTSCAAMDEDTLLFLDDIKQVQSFINVEKESPCSFPISQPGIWTPWIVNLVLLDNL